MTDESMPLKPSSRVGPAKLFLAFLRLGVTAFGGPAMVAYIREMAVTKKRWLSEATFQDGVALCQSIPGATAMQIAAYSGLRAGGPFGAAASFIGFGLPAFLIMLFLSFLYGEFQQLHVAESVFFGLRVIVVVIMANATWLFARTSLKNLSDGGLAIGTACFLFAGGAPALAIFLSAGLALVLYRSIKEAPRSEICEAPDSAGFARTAIWVAVVATAALAVLYCLDRNLFALAALMVKVNALALGGGYAAIPLMLHEVTEKRAWLGPEAFMDGIALGQVTPGPVVITATFVGFQVRGILGAVVATIAVFTPSFVLLLGLVPYFDRLQQFGAFRHAVRGALVCFVGLLFAVTVRFAIAIPWSPVSVLIGCLALAALRMKVDLIWVIGFGSLISAILF